MKKWIGKCESLPSYEFKAEERISHADGSTKIDLIVDYIEGRDSAWFNSMPSLRAFLRKEYGKVSLKLIKESE